ncbi:DUF4331 family protein [Sphingomicrobium marinum]|uniref:DUF4331 family protein n=1 Tax=Sphingomicrobium marinum TaxID=1227950 RepID=UPI0022402804|nr:DUF4331 family protein [Sphingomicrobium marinum]
MTNSKFKTILAPLALLGALAACDGENNSRAPDSLVNPPPPPPPMPTSFDPTPCLEQEIPGTGGITVADAVIPDTLTVNYTAASGFPNGRALPDPVIDVTLAVIFLDLSTNGPATLANLPLNPSANDLAFRSNFPYLAPAQGTPPAADTSGQAFSFDLQPNSSYVRVDRMGMPAVSTALIPTDGKIEYNDAGPADDLAGEFVPELSMVLTDLTNALADDLTAAGLTPCAQPI